MMDTFNPTSYSTIDLHMDFAIKLLVLAGVQGLEPPIWAFGERYATITPHPYIWRRGRDLNPRSSCPLGGLANRCTRPLCDPSNLNGKSDGSWTYNKTVLNRSPIAPQTYKMVRIIRLEPIKCCHHSALNAMRLPVSPHTLIPSAIQCFI